MTKQSHLIERDLTLATQQQKTTGSGELVFFILISELDRTVILSNGANNRASLRASVLICLVSCSPALLPSMIW